MSPLGLLFAMCVDILLEALSAQLSCHETLGAFADDIGIVVADIWKSSPMLQKVFSEFEEVSSLSLNVKKTVLIPLWRVA